MYEYFFQVLFFNFDPMIKVFFVCKNTSVYKIISTYY